MNVSDLLQRGDVVDIEGTPLFAIVQCIDGGVIWLQVLEEKTVDGRLAMAPKWPPRAWPGMAGGTALSLHRKGLPFPALN